MNKLKYTKTALLITFILSFLFIASFPVFSASETFFEKAQAYRSQICSTNKTTEQNAFFCYLFDKTQELDQDLTETKSTLGLESSINATQSAKIDELEKRLKSLESSVSANLHPQFIIIAQNQPQSSLKKVTLPKGYKSMTLSVSSSGRIDSWAPLVSFDGVDYRVQHRFNCSAICESVTVPILASNYQFDTATSSGLVTITAVLNPEYESKVITLSEQTGFPFQSDPFEVTDLNSIDITVGGGDEPQNLEKIVLQKQTNGEFKDYHTINCDGAALCPLDSIPLTDGVYQVQVIGSGGDGVVAVITRNTLLN